MLWAILAKTALLPFQVVDNLVGWPFTEPDRRWFRALNGVGRELLAKALFPLLTQVNTHSTASLLGDGPAVSLTTFGPRIPTAFATIESIGLGSVRPRRLVLWLDDPTDLAPLDLRLARQVARGLEVRLSANYGPHTKYYPYVAELWTPGTTLVTADDDILYPPNWLRLLADAQRAAPDLVNCHRARQITLQDGTLTPYNDWPNVRTTVPGPRVFATGVSGVSYPPNLLAQLRDRGTDFVDRCPKADDIWLHYMAVQNGVGVRQIRQRRRHFPVVLIAQVAKLQNENVAANGNDRQIAATYTPSALAAVLGGKAADTTGGSVTDAVSGG